DVIKNPEGVRKKLGYMSQQFSMYPDLTPLENLRFYGGIYAMGADLLERRIEEALEELELRMFKDSLTAALPLGFKQRLALASASLHRPEIIFLDEPTSGVDPIARVKFWSYVQKLVRENKITAIVTTHFLNEAEYCDNIILMHEGGIAAHGSPSQMKDDVEQQIKIFQIATGAQLKELYRVRQYTYIADIYSWGRNYRVVITRETGIDKERLIADFSILGIDILSIEEIKPSLEDVFIRYYQL
ncbi:MAG: hypothetical protein A2Y62_09615, partial [Candidatus Fischerbacteria bacterium RBG_13_37_8]